MSRYSISGYTHPLQPEKKPITFVYDGAEHSTPPRMFPDKKEEELKSEIASLLIMQQEVTKYEKSLYRQQEWK